MPRLPLVLLLPSLALPGLGGAQQLDRDSGRLIVRRGGAVVGQEEFSLERVAGPGGGLNLIITASYPPAAPTRMVASFGPRRITVRVASDGTETAREYPGGERTLVVAERALALYAVASGLTPGPVTLYDRDSPGRRSAALEDRGEPMPRPEGAPAKHVLLRTGDDVVELWYDAAGRLLRIAAPAKDLTAERALP